MSFVHLHTHSEYSLLDGASRISEMVRHAVETGMPAIALTDHGVLYGAVNRYLQAKAAGINPIIGQELYVATRSRHQKEGRADRDPHHLILLVKNLEGYRNLIQLSSLAHLEGYYYKPRIDKGLLAEHAQGLIALSSCLGGEVASRLLEGDDAGAEQVAREYQRMFGEDYFLEVQDHGIAEQGLKTRYPELGQVVRDRFEMEFGVIEAMGYAPYFLIVSDFIDFARQNGVAVGPGRGSAAGSIISYALGITTLDPIQHGLIFERFLNRERISMPDIDVDFDDRNRDRAIDYVGQTYGQDHVAQIITFGTMKARAVIRDVGRALDVPLREVDHLAKLVPPTLNMTLDKAIQMVPELAQAEKDPVYERLLKNARKLEGLVRHASTHAAGIVITPEPLQQY